MEVSKELKEKALSVAKTQKLEAVWVNNKNEIFTSENLASLSVKGKKEDFAKVVANAK